MPRHRVIVPNFEDKKFKAKQKRERFLYCAEIIWAVLLFICILISGLNQENDKIVGIAFLCISLINVLLIAIFIYAKLRGWRPIFTHERIESIRHLPPSENERENFEVGMIICFLALTGITVYCIITGITRII